ncbi:MAG: S-formylglutathione hydrolase [Acidobacteriota bacterium]|nr:S-formylglutathione hydrolase [Acidobacteriota bacterium]
MEDKLELKSETKVTGGRLAFYRHHSEVTDSHMSFSVYLPPQAEERNLPVLYWLSGLTCTEENFMIKSAAWRYAAQYGLMLVAPDTSPRGLNLPGEDDDWDFGSGAGFYLNAAQAPWSGHYRMYDYVVKELPALINANFPTKPDRISISGHSMGGHGALVIGQRNQQTYSLVSAFSPICAPMTCPWGQKAFSNYLGDDRETWKQYDATEILAGADTALPMFVDQGTVDGFLAEQLKPELLEKVCREKGFQLELRYQEGYDHSYYFIASFIGDHIAWHARTLNN